MANCCNLFPLLEEVLLNVFSDFLGHTSVKENDLGSLSADQVDNLRLSQLFIHANIGWIFNTEALWRAMT